MKDTQKAIEAYRIFLAAWSDADESLPQVLIAKTYIDAYDNKTGEAYFWIMIALVVVVVSVLGLVLIVVIYKYVSRKNEYRAVPLRT